MENVMKLKIISLSTFILLALNVKHALASMASMEQWDISKINVCFAEKETEYNIDDLKGFKRDLKPKEKQLIKNVLETEFTAEITGYTFVGFQDCKNTKNINVVIGVRKRFSKSSLSGISGMATVGPMKNSFTSYNQARGAIVFSSIGIDKTTIVHEFGHILGLEHEHDHPDAKVRANKPCTHYSERAEDFNNHIYGEFDETSVMNYCYTESSAGKNVGLSALDQQMILDIYNKK